MKKTLFRATIRLRKTVIADLQYEQNYSSHRCSTPFLLYSDTIGIQPVTFSPLLQRVALQEVVVSLHSFLQTDSD